MFAIKTHLSQYARKVDAAEFLERVRGSVIRCDGSELADLVQLGREVYLVIHTQSVGRAFTIPKELFEEMDIRDVEVREL